nr:hypothetical protein [uncultured Duganella sp.]
MSLSRSPWGAGALLLSVAVVSIAITVRFVDQDDVAPPAVATQAEPGHPAPRRAPQASATVVTPAPSVPVNEAWRTYTSANLFADCEERAKEPAANAGAPDEAYQIDATGVLAARLEKDRNARSAQCRMVGPAEYRQIEGMLRLAAAQGNRDAQGLLLRRRAQALLARAHGNDAADGQREFAPADEGEAKVIALELERLAFEGHRESIVALDQLLSAPQPSLADPTRAAAWRLVSYQAFGAPFPASDKLSGTAEILDDLDPASSQKVVTLAKSLFDSCCAR